MEDSPDRADCEAEAPAIYTDFADEMGAERVFELPGFAAPDGYERFRAKARHFLKAHEDHLTIHKLRTNEPLTPTDLAEFGENAGGKWNRHAGRCRESESREQRAWPLRPLFSRLGSQAAKKALGTFFAVGTLRANQLEFLDEVVNHLTEHGCMDAARLYATPYTDFHSQGVAGVFGSQQIETLISILEEVDQRARA